MRVLRHKEQLAGFEALAPRDNGTTRLANNGQFLVTGVFSGSAVILFIATISERDQRSEQLRRAAIICKVFLHDAADSHDRPHCIEKRACVRAFAVSTAGAGRGIGGITGGCIHALERLDERHDTSTRLHGGGGRASIRFICDRCHKRSERRWRYDILVVTILQLPCAYTNIMAVWEDKRAL